MKEGLRTAECVTPMHPDKICDRISDSVLDECLRQDPASRVAVEVMGGHGIITVTGEVTTKAFFNIQDIVRSIVGEKYGVQSNIVMQSPEIARGVDSGGAGDQGIMIGYACDENPTMIPQELYLARMLCKQIYEQFPVDGKTQITLDGDRIDSVVASFCGVSKDKLSACVSQFLQQIGVQHSLKVFVNPAGDWSVGGFDADTGVTGRKLAVDNYGPSVPIGGGAFSGKDATKVDRSGAYMARRVACETLKRLSAKEVFVRVAYVIGDPIPVEVSIFADGELLEPDPYTQQRFIVEKMIEELNLCSPVFSRAAAWGHFGSGLPWDCLVN